MRRYLLVLDRELISTGEQSRPEAISYIARRQEHEPCEVTVLSLLTSSQPQVPPFMALYTADKIGRYPKAPLPDQDIRAAEHRMDSAVQQLEITGCHATGVLTGQRQVGKAVRAETHGHHYDQVIVATSRQNGSWLARALLRLRLGRRLVIFPLGKPRAARARGLALAAWSRMTGRVARRRSWQWAVVPVLALTMTGCTSSAAQPGQLPKASASGGQSTTGSTAQQRFSVLLSTQARQLASNAGVSLSQLVASALNHINALLPGPPTVIVVQTGDPGGPGVPHWTASTIGYHIVNDYRDHHRDVSWAQLTAASATTILAASHYQPCPPPGSG